MTIGDNNILIVGDVHGKWGKLNMLINKRQPSMILSCGDFGYWPRFLARDFTFSLKNRGIPIHFCDGNHEDHESLLALKDGGKIPEMNDVFYQRRGSTMTLPDGRTVLFMGGADSIDKEWRTRGVSWFPEEVITSKDVRSLPDCNIDIVVSHTCPAELLPILLGEDPRKENDPSNAALSHILEKYSPSFWYFGHWHVSLHGTIGRTRWHALNMASETGWWRWLDQVD